MAQDAGFNLIGAQTDLAPQWPKHAFLANAKLIEGSPGTLTALLRAHVAALRLARADRALAVATLVERLKWAKDLAERAYDEVMPAYDERGRLPDAHMDAFWSLEIEGGSVKEAWPDDKLIDERFVRSFDQWMM
jgi:hypothetical protein